MRWVAALGLLAACAHAPPGPASTAPVAVRLERQGCYGECPIYTVVIYQDGTVQYDGDEYVKVKGRRTGTVDAAALARVRDFAARLGFASLPDYNGYDCTDLPGAVLTIDGATVEHYYGDAKAPEDLVMLESMVDDAAGIRAWVGTAGGPFAYTCF